MSDVRFVLRHTSYMYHVCPELFTLKLRDVAKEPVPCWCTVAAGIYTITEIKGGIQ
jgi:hypothetical protein